MSKSKKSFDLKKDIFKPIAKRIKEKKESLIEIRKFAYNTGFEGWLKVEAVAALGKKVTKVQNRGPDLELESGIGVELKAATDFNLSYIKGGALKYQGLCLFLGDGSNRDKIKNLESDELITLIGHETFSDGKNEWIIGLIGPSSQVTDKKPLPKVSGDHRKLRPSGKGAPQLHTVDSFGELKQVIRIRSLYYPTNYMDLLLVQNKNKKLSQIVKKFRGYAEPLGNNDFRTVSRLKTHIKYREDHDGWIFDQSGDSKDSVVVLVGLKRD